MLLKQFMHIKHPYTVIAWTEKDLEAKNVRLKEKMEIQIKDTKSMVQCIF